MKVVPLQRQAGWTPIIGVLGLVVLLLPGCRSTRPVATTDPQLAAIQADLAGIHPEDSTRARNTEIFDVHVHTFNARFLPLRGILQGKRDIAPPWSWLLTDEGAAVVARLLAERTELSPAGNQKSMERDTSFQTVEELPTGGGKGTARFFGKIINKAVDKGAWKPGMDMLDQRRAVDRAAEEMNPAQRKAILTISEMMGVEVENPAASAEEKVKSITRFLWTLTQNDADLPELYRRLHSEGGVTRPENLRVISHMMDLAPVYDQQADGNETLVDFQKGQIPRMEKSSKASNGKLDYFVAWNPYRDHWAGGQPGGALKIVQDAILNHGAKGVKIYPPSGYRAAGNVIPKRPWTLSTRKPGEQWYARYQSLEGTTLAEKAAALDRSMEQLLVWCEQKDIPVFTHSGYGEFEARKGYGEWNADPQWWEQYLSAHSRPGAPCQLRLCFGHAGGADHWFGQGTHGEWGKKVYQLCTTYPNVYCEITANSEMLNPVLQAHFVRALAASFAASQSASPATPYPFSKKLLYGTDWPLPDTGEPAAILRATQQAFLHQSLAVHYTDYFSLNARRWLRMR